MNSLLIFFSFPLAVIIFSIVLQKLLHNPLAVSSLIFAVFLVITFAVFDETFLIATLAYTILSFVTSLLVDKLCHSDNNDENIDTASIKDTVTSDDTVIGNNCGYMYNRRCRKF